jgi:hypothetical protein
VRSGENLRLKNNGLPWILAILSTIIAAVSTEFA